MWWADIYTLDLMIGYQHNAGVVGWTRVEIIMTRDWFNWHDVVESIPIVKDVSKSVNI